jgi:Zinc knuckle
MKGKQMIKLIRARRGVPNPRGFNNTFGQNQNQFRPRTWGGRPQQNQQRPQQQQQQQRPNYNSTTAPRPVYNNVQVPMDLSRTRTPCNRCQYWSNNTYTNTLNMQEAYGNAADTQGQTYQCQRPKGPCFNCRKMGHFAKDCRSNPSSNISYMDTDDDNMQNVPQPNITPQTNVSHLKAQIDALSTEDNDALIEAMGSSQSFTPA